MRLRPGARREGLWGRTRQGDRATVFPLLPSFARGYVYCAHWLLVGVRLILAVEGTV